MSKKKNKKNKPQGKGGGGGDAQEPLQVNWVALGLVVIGVVAVALFSASQQKPVASTSSSSSSAASVDCANGPSHKQYPAAPDMTVDPAKHYTATFKLAQGGEFDVQLFPDKAPLTVNSFVFLARDGYFNCLTFHRVLEGFMAQGGDPTGTGAGGPGYQFKNEDSDLKFDKAGVVAMANAGRDTNGSQFFITFGPQPSLDGSYTIFGQVAKGLDVVNGIKRRDPNDPKAGPGDMIQTITIAEQ